MTGLLVTVAKMSVAVRGKHDILLGGFIGKKKLKNWSYRICCYVDEFFQKRCLRVRNDVQT